MSRDPVAAALRMSLAPGVAGNVSSPPLPRHSGGVVAVDWTNNTRRLTRERPVGGGREGSMDCTLPTKGGAGAGDAKKSGHGGGGLAARVGPVMPHRSRPEVVVVAMAAAPSPAAFPPGRAQEMDPF